MTAEELEQIGHWVRAAIDPARQPKCITSVHFAYETCKAVPRLLAHAAGLQAEVERLTGPLEQIRDGCPGCGGTGTRKYNQDMGGGLIMFNYREGPCDHCVQVREALRQPDNGEVVND